MPRILTISIKNPNDYIDKKKQNLLRFAQQRYREYFPDEFRAVIKHRVLFTSSSKLQTNIHEPLECT